LLAALDAAIDALPPKRNIGRPRLPIDRVFAIGGFGTVVTGTLVDGTLVTGQDIEVMPGGARGRIRGLQTHKDKMDRALPGTRTAVNVTGIERHSLRRGMVLAAPGEAHEARLIDALVRVVRGAVHPLRHGMRVSFHCLADESNAQVRLLEKDLLGAGEQGWATIRLETRVAALRGDRFVLRTASDTIAGGIIVDTAPRRHRRRDPAVIEALTALVSERPADVIYAAVERHPGALLSDAAGSLSNEDAATAVRELTGAGRIVLLGGEPLLVTETFEERSRKEALSALTTYHAEYPLRVGMPVEELRSRLKLERHLLDRLLDRWSDVSTRATSAALTGFRPTLTAEQQQAADALVAALREAPFNPPATEGVDASILGYLEAAGAVVDAGAGVVFAREAFDEMRQRVEAHIRVHGSITLAQARDEFGTSRRYVQSLLEHLDRLRVTMRRGDERVLR
jgi:selenocysteine-specific elongation factor